MRNEAKRADDGRKVFELRLEGNSPAEIADRLGMCTTTVYGLMADYIKKMVTPLAEAARAYELAVLDRLAKAMDAQVRTGDVKAVAEVRQISARRSQLLGLDQLQPQKVHVQLHDAVDDAILALVKEHDDRARTASDVDVFRNGSTGVPLRQVEA